MMGRKEVEDLQEMNQGCAPMSMERLKRYMKLRREYRYLVESRKHPEQVTDQVRGSMVEFPYTTHTITISGADPAAARANQGRLEYLHAEMKDVERFVEGIEDGILRATLQQRFLRGKSWVQTGIALHGTTDSVRKAAERYMKRVESEVLLKNP